MECILLPYLFNGVYKVYKVEKNDPTSRFIKKTERQDCKMMEQQIYIYINILLQKKLNIDTEFTITKLQQKTKSNEL